MWLQFIAKANLTAVCLTHVIFYLFEQEVDNIKLHILMLSGAKDTLLDTEVGYF
jgi:hypothetical protein